MVQLFNRLDPMALYVVDSWGTQYEPALMEYMRLADRHLNPGISLGYHGHNNLMQAYSVAQTFVNSDIQRDKIVDASVYGIGRGAGNLNLELFAKYLNDIFNRDFRIAPMVEVYEDYIKRIYEECPWGYCLPFFVTAQHGANPNYGSYYGLELKLSSKVIGEILGVLSDEDRIIYTREKADKYLAEYEESEKN
jgi:4-hydroxy 2-oxovalerate aldolase